MSEQMVVISNPVEYAPGVPGSVKQMGTCGHEVWVAPSTIKVLEKERAADPSLVIQIVCVPCGLIQIEKEKSEGKPIEIKPPTPEQLEELLAAKAERDAS